MSYRDRHLTDYVPDYYRELRESAAILDVETNEMHLLYRRVYNVLDQFFVDTATWGLDYWEKIVGIETDKNIPLETRRKLIKERLQGFGTLTEERFREIVNEVDERITYEFDFDNYTVVFRVPADVVRRIIRYHRVKDFRVGYRFAEFFNDPTVDLELFKREMRVILPAHLDIAFSIVERESYLIFSDDVNVKAPQKVSTVVLKVTSALSAKKAKSIAETMRLLSSAVVNITEYYTVSEFKVGNRIAKDIREVAL